MIGSEAMQALFHGWVQRREAQVRELAGVDAAGVAAALDMSEAAARAYLDRVAVGGEGENQKQNSPRGDVVGKSSPRPQQPAVQWTRPGPGVGRAGSFFPPCGGAGVWDAPAPEGVG